jgi:protein CMS1
MAICDTTSWNSPRNLENLPGFLEKFSSNPTKLWSASKKMGAPHTIVVAGAGLRAADLARYSSLYTLVNGGLTFNRVLRKFQTKDVTVAKLFAKHIKVKDAIKFLQNTRTGMAVGTPTRLNELMDDGIYE